MKRSSICPAPWQHPTDIEKTIKIWVKWHIYKDFRDVLNLSWNSILQNIAALKKKKAALWPSTAHCQVIRERKNKICRAFFEKNSWIIGCGLMNCYSWRSKDCFIHDVCENPNSNPLSLDAYSKTSIHTWKQRMSNWRATKSNG